MRKGFAAAACLCVTAVADAEPSPLSGQEISELVAGATVEIDAPLGFKVPLRYTRDGRVSGEASTALSFILGAASDTGRWWVEPDQICHKWKIWFNGYPQCFRMTRDGQKFYWRTFDDKTGTATIIVPAPPVQAAAVTPSSVPAARVPAAAPEVRAPRAAEREPPEPAAATETSPPVPIPAARPEVAKKPAEQGTREKGPAASAVRVQAASAQAPSSRASTAATSKVASAQAPSPRAPGAQTPNAPAGRVSRAGSQPAPAPAPEPAFMVVNVPPGDVLNVRKGPSVEFDVVGGLPPDSRGVTVTGECQLRWCPVAHPSARGWVNSTYLAREEPPGTRRDASITGAKRTGAN